MIQFDALDFTERRSEEVMFLLTLNVGLYDSVSFILFIYLFIYLFICFIYSNIFSGCSFNIQLVSHGALGIKTLYNYKQTKIITKRNA